MTGYELIESAGVPIKASPEKPPRRWASWRTVRPSFSAMAMARARPLLLALLSGISGSGPSGSNFEDVASQFVGCRVRIVSHGLGTRFTLIEV